jgi:hypothetical protein
MTRSSSKCASRERSERCLLSALPSKAGACIRPATRRVRDRIAEGVSARDSVSILTLCPRPYPSGPDKEGTIKHAAFTLEPAEIRVLVAVHKGCQPAKLDKSTLSRTTTAKEPARRAVDTTGQEG